MTVELLTREEAAAALRVSPSTLDRLRRAGRIAETYIGRRVLIPATEIRQIVAQAAPRRVECQARGIVVDAPLW